MSNSRKNKESPNTNDDVTTNYTPTYPIGSCGKYDVPAGRFPIQSLFRNPHYILPLLSKCSRYVVYFISAHGETLGTFQSDEIDSELPFAVIQTGGGESIGCSFISGYEGLMMSLFSQDILHSFQQLLGLYGDRITPFYKDLHYATSDEQIVDGEPVYEEFPNKLLYYKDSDISTIRAGVYCYDPAKKVSAFSPAFQRMNAFDELFNPDNDGGGITIQKLLEAIPQKIKEVSAETNMDAAHYSALLGRIPIYIISACAAIPPQTTQAMLNRILKTSSAVSHYSVLAPGQPYLIKPIPLQKGIPYPKFVTGETQRLPSRWRNTTRPYSVHRFFLGRSPSNIYTRKMRRLVRKSQKRKEAAAAGAATGGAGTGKL